MFDREISYRAAKAAGKIKLSNNWQSLSAESALLAGQGVTNIVKAVPNGYGFNEGLLGAFHQNITDLSAAIDAAYNADLAAKAARQAKNDLKDSMTLLLGTASKQASANGNVTDQMLLAIGFAPRASGGAKPSSLNPPLDLKIVGTPEGLLKVSWKRNGSKQGTMFVLESSENGIEWSYLATTTRASYSTDGHAPGDPIWIRATATTSTLRSPASLPISLYAPVTPSAVPLHIAA